MAKTYETIGWQDATQLKPATVVVDGTEYEVTPELMSGTTPINATNLKHMDDAIKDLYDGGASTTDIVISPEEPTTEDWKIWIDTDEVNNLGSEVVDTLEGNETNKAPSVNAVNNKFEKSILDAWRPDYTTKGTDYEKVNFTGINNKKGTAFTVSDGNIICNKDMLISIEGSYYWTGISSKRVGYRVIINDASRRVFNKFCDNGGYYEVSLDRALYQVKQGDIISLYVRTEEGAGGTSGSRGNFILQEL